MFMWTEESFWLYVILFIGWVCKSCLTDHQVYEHNARSGGTTAAPRENDLVWRLVVPVPGD